MSPLILVLLLACYINEFSVISLRPSSSLGKRIERDFSPLSALTSGEREVESSTGTDDILPRYTEELEKLRGTAELVDRLENLVSKHPGIEVGSHLQFFLLLGSKAIYIHILLNSLAFDF